MIVRGSRKGVEDATWELCGSMALHDAEEALVDISYTIIVNLIKVL